MKKGKGKQKGSSFERDVCKQLSLWWTKGKNEDCFWRSAGSGAKATVTDSRYMCGDLVQIDLEFPPFPFSCEFKFYKTFDLYDLFEPEKKDNLILSWLKQCINDARRARKIPLLIMKRNYFDELVILPENLKEKWRDTSFLYGISFRYKNRRYLIAKLKNFLDINSIVFKK